ncbi:unnamed protein product [Closterium sp. NIES-64]|nr:unnamed protein product [Closterium sp. NIES-64]
MRARFIFLNVFSFNFHLAQGSTMSAAAAWERTILIAPNPTPFAPLSARALIPRHRASLTGSLYRIAPNWRPEILGSTVAIPRRQRHGRRGRRGDDQSSYPRVVCSTRRSDAQSGDEVVESAGAQQQGAGDAEGAGDVEGEGDGKGESGVQWVEERGLRLQVQGSFYRRESAVGRDLATLVAWRDARTRSAAEEQQHAEGQAEEGAVEEAVAGIERSAERERSGRRGAEAEGAGRGMKEQQRRRRRRRGFRVLDVLSGSGVRGARYLSQGGASFVWCNDASVDTHAALVANLQAVSGATADDAAGPAADVDAATSVDARPGKKEAEGPSPFPLPFSEPFLQQHTPFHLPSFPLSPPRSPPTGVLLRHDMQRQFFDLVDVDAFGSDTQRQFFDLVDVDAFGSDTRFIGPALAATARGGLLYLTATDGFSSAGHAPFRALAAYGTYMRPLPFCNELGLRMLLGAAVREAAVRKLTVAPVFSLYAPHGPVFRALVRVHPASPHQQWQGENYGFIAHCHSCGHSKVLAWDALGCALCNCLQRKGHVTHASAAAAAASTSPTSLSSLSLPSFENPSMETSSSPSQQQQQQQQQQQVSGGMDDHQMLSQMGLRRMVVVGPLWVGPLHDPMELRHVAEDARVRGWKAAGRVLEVMQEEAQEGLPPWFFKMDHVSAA